jgi:hypothetical protein
MTPPIRFPRPLRDAYGLIKAGDASWKAHYYLNNRLKTVRLTATTLEGAIAERDTLYAGLAECYNTSAPGPSTRERGIRYRKPWEAWDGKTKVGEFDTMDEAKHALREHKINNMTV